MQRMKLLEVQEMNMPPLKLGAKVAERTLETVLDEHGLRISLYYMPKGTHMPLHDHPQMMVLTFILEGQVSANFYTPTIHHSVYFKEHLTL
jgi:quercetin dioxygenase-like cupin family protein